MPKRLKSNSAKKQRQKQKLFKKLYEDDGEEFRTAEREPGMASDSESEPDQPVVAEPMKRKKGRKQGTEEKNQPTKQKKRRILEDVPETTDAKSPLEPDSQAPHAHAGGKNRLLNKQKVLVFSSRGVTYRQRHLMNDLRALLPHSKKDVKLDSKDELAEVNDVCEVKNCNGCIFFESRKGKDLYIWIAKVPHGPSVKFHCVNIHTMDELKMSGNCVAGARCFLSFTEEFDTEPHWMLVKELLAHLFATPANHPKTKRCVDHVMNFAVNDGRIWVRNYQIVEVDETSSVKNVLEDSRGGSSDVDLPTPLQDEEQAMEQSGLELMEIGPRFTLEPIRVFSQSFRGSTLYENADFVSPNEIRRAARLGSGMKTAGRDAARRQRTARKAVLQLPRDELEDTFH